jgi:hypothetical protein
MFMVFVAFLMCIISRLSAQQHHLSICTIFRDDAKYLPEWIDFHRSQGVDHFYLYDNLSNDDPEYVLKDYIKDGSVTLVKWPYESLNQADWNKIQCSAYMHCVKKYGHNSLWMAFLDTDEFLFCPNKSGIGKFLFGLDKKIKSISAFWRMYGTGNLKIPDGGMLRKHLLYRAEDDNGAHVLAKPIAQTKYIKDIINPHHVILKKGRHLNMSPDAIRINHYWSRDLEFFHNVKLSRRQKWYLNRQEEIDRESWLNDVYDPILRDF